MCGIAGIVHTDRELAEQALASMVSCQAHRGPDDQGIQWLQSPPAVVGLGQRRLSILDLSPLGHQPMIHPATGDTLVFNGEIYNFPVLRKELEDHGVVFRGHSDTEVLLHALVEWGPVAIGRLQGMYAFAFYERRNHRLLLARDPMGIKPLYTHQSQGVFMFASEVRPFLASGLIEPRINPRGVASFLAFGSVQEPDTIIRGVSAFPAAHWQWLTAEEMLSGRQGAPRRYWDFPRPTPTTESHVVAAVRETMDAAVKDHLISDVPVGIFLSSGLDSTIIAALAGKHHQGIQTFTVGFSDQPDMSESAMAQETARLFGLTHTNIPLTQDIALGLAQQWLVSLDQPSMDGLNVFVISSVVRNKGIKVALTGQGGDELFAGYDSFNQIGRILGSWRGLHRLPRWTRPVALAAVGMNKSESVRQKLTDLAASDGSLLSLYLHRRRSMSNHQLRALGIDPLAIGLTRDFMPPESLNGIRLDEKDLIWSVSLLESRFYQGNTLLRDSDTNGMAHGLEIRVPILDRRMIDLVYAIPGAVRVPPGGPGKHLLREAFKGILRQEILSQKKRGFTLPIRRWMRGEFSELCESELARLKQSGVVIPGAVDEIWRSFARDPESPIWSRAWCLVILGRYLSRLQDLAATRRPSRAVHVVDSPPAQPLTLAATGRSTATAPAARRTKVFICWPEISGYMASCWRQLAASGDIDLFVLAIKSGERNSVASYNDAIVHAIDCRLMTLAESQDPQMIRRMIVEARPDIVVLPGWAIPAYTALPTYPELRKCRFIMCMDTPWRSGLRQRLARWKIGRYLDRMDRVVVAGERSWQYAQHLKIPQHKVLRGVYGFDYDAMAPCYNQRLANPGGWPRRFVFTGRYVQAKGIDVMVDAYRQYRSRVRSPWPMACCGRGPLADLIRSTEGIEDLGFVQPEDLPAVYVKSGVAVLASRYEPWGVAVAEALGSGLPIICTEATSAAVELVRPYFDGLIVATDNPDSLARGLAWMHEHHDQLPQMGLSGQQFAAAYSAQSWTRRWVAMIRDLMQESGGNHSGSFLPGPDRKS